MGFDLRELTAEFLLNLYFFADAFLFPLSTAKRIAKIFWSVGNGISKLGVGDHRQDVGPDSMVF